ncbi:MAG TPA: hypothetical protein VFQ61_26740 [Polyangiaceae bacterium]|nr:hypothetical protein [Polyangiaceae bacterium]
MPTPPNPPTGPHVDLDDDPLLPWLVATRSGDRSAEHELLLRLAPITLGLARRLLPDTRTRPDNPKDQSALAFQALLLVLRALPSLRGEERTSRAVAKLTLEAARRFPGTSTIAETEALSAARELEQATARGRDDRLVHELADRAFRDDSSILVSQVIVKPGEATRRSRLRLALAALGLLTAAWLGYLLGTRRNR